MNLGPTSRLWLSAIGVRTVADIRRIGSVEIYRLLKAQGYPASMNLVYAMEGAVLGLHWNALPASVKAELRRLAGKAGARR